jgi:hypothetical protein
VHAVNVRHEQGQMPGKLGSNTQTKREKTGKNNQFSARGQGCEISFSEEVGAPERWGHYMHKTRNSKVVSPKPFGLGRWKVEMGGNNNTAYSPGTCVSGLFNEHLCSECNSELLQRK